MPRSAEHGEQTKRNIAQRARTLFEEKGYSATTLEDIRKASDSSKGSIYYHFKNKETLFLYILEQSMQAWLDEWSRLEAPLSTAKEKLYRLAAHYADDFRNPLVRAGEEFAGSTEGDAEIRDRLHALTRLHYPAFQRVIEEGIANGEFRDIPLEDMTYILSGLLGGLSIAYYEVDMERLSALYKRAVDVLLQGIQND